VNSPADWQTELSSAFRDTHSLAQFLGQEIDNDVRYPLLITKKYAQLIKDNGVDGVLARQFLPTQSENSEKGFIDPIGDKKFSKTSQLIHRYHNRALLIPTTTCPILCRYCFRKNELNSDGPFAQDQEATLNYLQTHPEIEEIIFTGGDPFILTDNKISQWLHALASIDHIKFIRFHSRVPVILPSRMTLELKNMLTSFVDRFQIIIVIHSNHVSEWSPEAIQSLRNFQSENLIFLSQSVLLKGINDNQKTLKELFHFFVQNKIRPYYLHHPDQVKGAEHFELSLEEGRRIWAGMHDLIPGWMLPQYTIDIPHGHGKTQAFNPESIEFSGSFLDRKGRKVPVDK
jgi:lysine 2,3-aminomutase